ncbi:lectin-like domain-containing protein, partial [Pediococcus acidilactici]
MKNRRYPVEEKTRYKLYKSKKKWLVAGVTLFSFGLGMNLTHEGISANENVVLKNSSTEVKADKNSTSTINSVAADNSKNNNLIVVRDANNKATKVNSNDKIETDKSSDSALRSSEENTRKKSNSLTVNHNTDDKVAGSSADNKATSKATSSSASSSTDSKAASSSADSNITSKATSSSASNSADSKAASSSADSNTTTTSKVTSSSANSSATSKATDSTASSNLDSKAPTSSASSRIENKINKASSPEVKAANANLDNHIKGVNSNKLKVATASKNLTSLKVNKKDTHEISYKELLAQLVKSGQASDAFTHVTAENFLNYFSLNGSATYDAKTGIVTLTKDAHNQVGNFALNSKIDMGQSFTLTGQINIGSNPHGADGISFAFHNGNTNDVGQNGGNLGIGGLQDAIGWKIDTWHNNEFTPTGAKNGDQINDGKQFGWSADPDGSYVYGGFVNTSNKQIKATDGNYYQRWWAETEMNSVQNLDPNNIDGKFHDFIAQYNGSTRQLTISYTTTDGMIMTWSKKVNSSYDAMALIVSGSTGSASNLQQFKINSFDFYQAATVNVTYVDQQGNILAKGQPNYPNGAYVNGTYQTNAAVIPGYNFIKMDDGSITGKVSLPANGSLTDVGDNGTVIYVYAPAYTVATNAVNEKINYLDKETNQPVADAHVSGPVTFVTVTNPVDGSKVTYYSTTETTVNLNKETGVPIGNWIKGDKASFEAVVSPDLSKKGYTAPDKSSIDKQNINANSADLNFNVYYGHQTVPVTPDNPKDPDTPINPDDPDSPDWPAGLSEDDLTQTITRTINYYDKETGEVVAKQVTQPVTYHRTAIIDKVTGEILGYDTNGDGKVDTTDGNAAWVDENGNKWADVKSPDLSYKGYGTPDISDVAEQMVHPGDKDQVVNVYYSRTKVPVTPDDPKDPDTPINPD